MRGLKVAAVATACVVLAACDAQLPGRGEDAREAEGEVLGGSISDNWSWHWIFFINVPVVVICAMGAARVLAPAETPTERVPFDAIGLSLLELFVGALQLMLDLGREHDWFADPLIVGLAVTAAIGFAVFLVWELTERRPIVDLSVFRHRGFTFATVALSATFGAFFASVVIIPQWLQVSMGYTATYAGYVTAMTGVAAVFMSPVAAKLTTKVDPRLLVCCGVTWLGLMALLRTQWTSGADFWTLALPQLLQGFGMPFFFIPLTTIALGAVEPEETASAAGVMSFLRTVAGAIGTTVAVSLWDDQARVARSEIVARLNPEQVSGTLQAGGFSLDQVRAIVERLVEQEAMAVATNHLFFLSAVVFALAAAMIWLSPRPSRTADPGAAH